MRCLWYQFDLLHTCTHTHMVHNGHMCTHACTHTRTCVHVLDPPMLEYTSSTVYPLAPPSECPGFACENTISFTAVSDIS